jgi:hypothetical protein
MVEETAGERETWVSTERGVVARKESRLPDSRVCSARSEGTENVASFRNLILLVPGLHRSR